MSVSSNLESARRGRRSTGIPDADAIGRFSVYVIEFDARVLSHRKFCQANPQHDPSKACLYVGMTALCPDERFRQHKAGIKANSYARRYGKWLRRRLYQRFNPMTYEDACNREKHLANDLRAKGYAVWQK